MAQDMHEDEMDEMEQVMISDGAFPSPGDGARYMVPAFCTCVEDLWDMLKQCKDECCGNKRLKPTSTTVIKSYHCPLCTPDRYKPNRLKPVKSHLALTHFKKRIGGDTEENPNGKSKRQPQA
jgi:hypothetical protein